MRIGFKTTLEESLISDLKIEAVKNKVNVNDILEELIIKFLKGEIKLNVGDKIEGRVLAWSAITPLPYSATA